MFGLIFIESDVIRNSYWTLIVKVKNHIFYSNHITKKFQKIVRAPFITRYLNRFTLPIPQVYAYSKSTYNPYIWLDNKDICVKKLVLQQAIPIKWDTPQIKVHKWCNHCEHVSGSQLGWLQAVNCSKSRNCIFTK